jgi:hypothetical protein
MGTEAVLAAKGSVVVASAISSICSSVELRAEALAGADLNAVMTYATISKYLWKRHTPELKRKYDFPVSKPVRLAGEPAGSQELRLLPVYSAPGRGKFDRRRVLSSGKFRRLLPVHAVPGVGKSILKPVRPVREPGVNAKPRFLT